IRAPERLVLRLDCPAHRRGHAFPDPVERRARAGDLHQFPAGDVAAADGAGSRSAGAAGLLSRTTACARLASRRGRAELRRHRHIIELDFPGGPYFGDAGGRICAAMGRDPQSEPAGRRGIERCGTRTSAMPGHTTIAPNTLPKACGKTLTSWTGPISH